MTTQHWRGIVSGILSGNSLIIRFLAPCPVPQQIVCLEHLIAPKFGRNDGSSIDEPHAFDSWNFLREISIGERVMVPSNCRPTDQVRAHPSFGQLPTTFTRVLLYDKNEMDLGIAACKAGFVKVRPLPAEKTTQPYIKQLLEAEEFARANNLGIWRENGMVRRLPVKVNPENILAQHEYDIIIEGVKNGTTLTAYLMPNHEYIYIRLAGCRSFVPPDPLGLEALHYTRNSLLNRSCKVRLYSLVDSMSGYHNEVKTFLGSFVDSKYDKIIVNMIRKGLASFNKKNADYSLFPDEYLEAQMEAYSKGDGIWKNKQGELNITGPSQLRGVVTSLRNSNGLCVISGDEQHIIYFNSLKVPRFSLLVGSEPYGFEAREFLRTRLMKQIVDVNIDGVCEDRKYATVYFNGISINELLCKEGLAMVAKSPIKAESATVQKATTLMEQAKQRGIGIWNPKPIEPIRILDFTTKEIPSNIMAELKDKTLSGIVERVSGGARFHILVPSISSLIRIGLNGIIPLSKADRVGLKAKDYCQKMYLMSDVLVQCIESDFSGCIFSNLFLANVSPMDISVDLLRNGFVEIHSKMAKNLEEEFSQRIQAQNHAKAEGLGVWQDKTRHLPDLNLDTVYDIKLTSIWNTTTFSTQFISKEMEIIKKALQGQLVPLTNNPLKNDCVVVKQGEEFSRARVENVDLERKIVTVKLIDEFKNADVPQAFVYELPTGLDQVPPQGRSIRLAFIEPIIKPPEESQRDTESIWASFKESRMYMHIVSDDGHLSVLITDKKELESGLFNAFLVGNRIANFSEPTEPIPPKYQAAYDQIKKSLEEENPAETTNTV